MGKKLVLKLHIMGVKMSDIGKVANQKCISGEK